MVRPMTLQKNPLLRWANTLKFKIVAIAVVTGVVSAMGTTQIVLGKTQAEIERLLLRNDADDSERTAALLANKLDMLQLALGAVARDGRYLVTQALATTGGHQHQRVAATNHVVDDLGLGTAKRAVAEDVVQDRLG